MLDVVGLIIIDVLFKCTIAGYPLGGGKDHAKRKGHSVASIPGPFPAFRPPVQTKVWHTRDYLVLVRQDLV